MNKLTARSCNLISLPVRRTRTGETFSIASLLFNDGHYITRTSGVTCVTLRYDEERDHVIARDLLDPSSPVLFFNGCMVVEVLR